MIMCLTASTSQVTATSPQAHRGLSPRVVHLWATPLTPRASTTSHLHTLVITRPRHTTPSWTTPIPHRLPPHLSLRWLTTSPTPSQCLHPTPLPPRPPAPASVSRLRLPSPSPRTPRRAGRPSRPTPRPHRASTPPGHHPRSGLLTRTTCSTRPPRRTSSRDGIPCHPRLPRRCWVKAGMLREGQGVRLESEPSRDPICPRRVQSPQGQYQVQPISIVR